MRVHVVGPVLRIVLQDEDRRIVPERRVRHRLHQPAHRQVVVRHRRLRRRPALHRPCGVVIRQPDGDVVRHGVCARRTVGDPPLKVPQENIQPNLVRHAQVEVRRLRGKVPHQLRLGRHISRQQRNRPRPPVHPATPFRGNLLARLDRAPRTSCPWQQRPLLRTLARLHAAERGRDVFAEVVMRPAVCVRIAPHISARRLDNVRNLLLDGIPVRHHPFVVICPLPAAIVLLPGFLQVIRPDRRIRPHMPVARDLTRIEEVVQHAKLQRQLVLVRGDAFAIHGQARVAVAHRLPILLQVAEELVVGPVLLDDVNHMLDWIGLACKRNRLRRRLHPVRLQHLRRRRLQVHAIHIDRRQRPIQQRRNKAEVSLQPRIGGPLHLPLGKVVRPRPVALRGRHIQLAARHGHRGGHPLRGNKPVRLGESLLHRRLRQLGCIDHRDSVGPHIRRV